MKLKKEYRNKLIRRSISLVLALAMLVNETYFWSILDELGVGNGNAQIEARADELEIPDPKYKHFPADTNTITVDIAALSEYSEYCHSYPWYHRNDDIKILATDQSNVVLSNFKGIGGSKDYPFEGSIEISAQTLLTLSLDGPLFDHVSDSARLIESATGPVTLSRYYDSSVTDKTAPLLANHVYHKSETSGEEEEEQEAEETLNTWKIRIATPYIGDTMEELEQFGGLIGTMHYDKNADKGAGINLEVEMKRASGDDIAVPITGKDDLGFVCCKMEKNTTCDFSYTATNGAIASISTSSGDVGSFVGEMAENSLFKYSGANYLGDGVEISSATGGYAGGLVGRNVGGTVEITLPEDQTSYAIKQTITNGTNGSGSIYGYYCPNDNVTFDTSAFSVDCKVNGNGYCGGLFGKLESEFDVTVNGGATVKSVHDANGSSGSCSAYGGLIGQYNNTKDNASNALTIDNVSVETDRTAAATCYGGGIGLVGDGTTAEKPAYVKFNSFTVSNAKNAGSLTFGGLVAKTQKAFIDANNVSVSVNGTFKGGAVVGYTNEGIVRLTGFTDISAAKSSNPGTDEQQKVGQLVGYRDNALVFAEPQWDLRRYSTDVSVDDIGAWGEIIRFSSVTKNSSNDIVTSSEEKIGGTKVLTVNETAHTVTVAAPAVSYGSIAGTAEFAKTALRLQFDNTSLLSFESADAASSVSSIVLTGNVDLRNTGITGLTRDNNVGGKHVFAGSFDGGGNTVYLAVGEYYGTRGGSAINDDSVHGSGKIYRHLYNGLIGKLSPKNNTPGKVSNVTIDGYMMVHASHKTMHVGSAAAQATGNLTMSGITVDTNISYGGGSELYLGGLLGEADGSIGSIDIENCIVNASIFGSNSAADKSIALSNIAGVIGRISHEGDSDKNWNFKTVTVSGSVSNSSSLVDPKIGGLIAVIPGTYNGNEHTRTLTLDGVNINGLSVTANGSSSMGGLFGYSWLKTNVNVGKVTTGGTTPTTTSVTVQDSGSNKSTVSNSGAGGLGGMIYRATGKWTVNSLDVDNIKVNCSGDVGMIVNKGISHDDSTFYTNAARSAVYLCLPDENNYSLAIDADSTITGSVFDELCAYTALDAASVLRNGNGVISVGATFKTDGASNSGSYKAKTSYGAKSNAAAINPNSRYYYNLHTQTAPLASDPVFAYNATTNPNADQNKLMSWGLNQYACTNIKKHFADCFGSTIANSNGKTFDMTGYSWYPVDLDKGMTVTGTFKFYSHEFELSEDVKAGAETNTFDRSNLEENQHYTMHCGLFRNVASGTTLNVGNTTFQGNVGIIAGGSGALIRGTVQGSDNNRKSTVKITGPVSLDGVYVYGVGTETVEGSTQWNYAPLLINKVGSFTDLNVANVKTTDTYQVAASVPYIAKESTYPKAASSLIGDVGLGDSPTSINVNFNNIKLDGRKTAISDSTYNTELTAVYGSDLTVFTRSTLLNQFKYVSGSTGTYNYTSDEDWSNSSHAGLGVTYGKEVGYTFLDDPNTEYPGQEQKYSGTSGYFTSPDTPAAGTAYGGFKTGFIPYVYIPYNSTNKTHQLRVNHEASTATGCGTYNDPYVLSDGYKLEAFSYWINTGFENDDTILIPTDNFSKNNSGAITVIGGTWCKDKSAHAEFKYSYDEGVFKGTIDSTEYTIAPTVMQTYLAGAYYKIPDEVSEITIPTTGENHKHDFKGLGNTTANNAVFRGVIDGNGRTIVNKTVYPLIESSNGSVIKDLNIKVQPSTAIERSGYQSAFDTVDTGNGVNEAYGAVIAKIHGGDNIIDNVTVGFGDPDSENEAEKKAAITLGGASHLVPVGAYVGTVINGGLYFRNMPRVTRQGDEILYDKHLMDNVTLSSGEETITVSDNNKKWLYVNPIIGRVINGFAVTESGVSEDGGVTYTEDPAYRPFEDGTRQYPDVTDETDENWDAGHVTMQNGTKNYSIADINSTDTSSFSMNGIADNSNITISSAQALYIMSLITECGLGKSSNGYYTQLNNLKPYDNYMATHNEAAFNYIGTSDTDAVSDHAKTSSDKYAETTGKIPYIIKKYTNPITVTDSTIYPAFDVMGDVSHSFNLILDTASPTTFYLPDGYRGLGSLMFNVQQDNLDSFKDNVVFLKSLDGKGNTVSLNMNLRVYKGDNYPALKGTQASFKTGFALIDCLQSSGTFENLTICGNVDYKKYGTNGDVIAYNKDNIGQNTDPDPAAAAFVGVPVAGSSSMTFNNINVDGMDISGMCYVGGFVGVVNIAATLTFTGCKADNLKIFAGCAAGGLIGYLRNNDAKVVADFEMTGEGGEKEQGTFGIISIISAFASDSINTHEAPGAGGLIGYRKTGVQNPSDAENFTISNVIIKNGSRVNSGYIGYNKDASTPNTNYIPAGGIIGHGNAATILNATNVTVENLDIWGAYAGGFIGRLTNAKSKFTITDCKVRLDSGLDCEIKSNKAAGSSGGFIGYNDGANDSLITNSEFLSYTVTATENVGGLIGYNNSIYKVCANNINIEGHTLKADKQLGGLIGNLIAGELDGYNILIKDQASTLNTAKKFTNKGYIVGSNKDKTKDIKLAGFSRQGTIDTALMVGNSTSASAEAYGKNGYVVFADYNDTATTEQNPKFSNVDTESNNIGATGSARKVQSKTFKQKATGTTMSGGRIDESGFTNQPDEAYDASAGTDYVTSYSGKQYKHVPNTVSSVSDLTFVTSLSELTEDQGFYMWSDVGNGYITVKDTVNGVLSPDKNNALPVVAISITPVEWHFHTVSASDHTYNLYIIENDTAYYVKNLEDTTNSVDLAKPLTTNQSEAAIFKISDAYAENTAWNNEIESRGLDSKYKVSDLSFYTNSFYFKKALFAGGTYNGNANTNPAITDLPEFLGSYLQYNSNRKSFRYYTNHYAKEQATKNPQYESNRNSAIKICYIPSSTKLQGAEYSSITINDSTITPVGSPTSTWDADSTEQAAYVSAFGTSTDGILYDITEYRKKNIFETPDSPKPFVTTNPKRFITQNDQFLTGDGVSAASYNDSAFRSIVEDSTNKAYNHYQLEKSEGATDASAIEDIKAALSNSRTEFKSYFGENIQTNNITNFPLLLAENTNKVQMNRLINNYLKILTNTDYDFANINEKICEVALFTCAYNEDTREFELGEKNKSNLKVDKSKSRFYMEAKDVDTKDIPQFTLMDLQFKNPSNTDEVAYHLYVPIYVKKVLHYDFFAEIKSGTDYYSDAYTMVDRRDHTRQALFENLGNPVTICFKYQYDRTAAEWRDAVNSGDSLLTNYYKSLTLKNHTVNGWAADTRMVLVDASNKDKYYYLDTPPAKDDSSASEDDPPLNLVDFTDNEGNAYKPVDFQDLMTVTIGTDAEEGNLVKIASGDSITYTVDGTQKTIKATVKDSDGNYYAYADDDTRAEIATALSDYDLIRYSVTEISDIKKECYYLTIFTKQPEEAAAEEGEGGSGESESSSSIPVYRYEISTPDKFEPSGTGSVDSSREWTMESFRANKKDKNTVINLFTGKLYDIDLDLDVESATTMTEMSASNRDLNIKMTASIELTRNAKENRIYENMDSFKDLSYIYQTFQMMYEEHETADSSKVGVDPDAHGAVSVNSYTYQGKKYNKDNYPTATAINATNKKVIEDSKYIELRNNVNLIGLLSDQANNYAASLQVRFKMGYNTEALSIQFPKKDTADATQNAIGTKVVGYSRIGSTKESAVNSATSAKAVDSKLFYTTTESTATLEYNVEETPVGSNNPVGIYSSLGINAVESGNSSLDIDTFAIYDTHTLTNPGDYVELTLSLSNKQLGYLTPIIGEPIPTEDTAKALKLSDYFTDLKIYGADNNNDGKDDVIFDMKETTDVENIIQTYKGDYLYKVRVKKDRLKTNGDDDIFVIGISYKVQTGDAYFKMGGKTYSNYKVNLTAAMYPSMESENFLRPSYVFDHFIYTNAKVATTVIR